MKKNLWVLFLALSLPVVFAFANDDTVAEEEDFSQRQIYSINCYLNKDIASGVFDITGAVNCPPGKDQTFGRAFNAVLSRRNSAMTCAVGADYYFFSHTDGKCYKYETTVNNKLEKDGGRWICYSKSSNNCL